MITVRVRSAFACLLSASALLSACSEGPAAPGASGPTLAEVRARGYVRCGAGKDTTGFSAPDAHGRWRGLDVDTCRAIAVAALGSRDDAKCFGAPGQGNGHGKKRPFQTGGFPWAFCSPARRCAAMVHRL